MNNSTKSKRGISPILATLLLVVIAVAAIVVTYAWIMTYMTNAGQQAGVQLYKANVSFHNSTTIYVDVGNSGTEATQIIQVYFGTSASALQSQTTTVPDLPVQLPKGSVARVAFNPSPAWASGTTYYFKVLSSSGQTLPPWTELAP